jgi:hypothetical protein
VASIRQNLYLVRCNMLCLLLWHLQEAKADVPLLKLFEFLTASLCLYVIEEEPACPLHK